MIANHVWTKLEASVEARPVCIADIAISSSRNVRARGYLNNLMTNFPILGFIEQDDEVRRGNGGCIIMRASQR